jgi:kynurenine aminotransferase
MYRKVRLPCVGWSQARSSRISRQLLATNRHRWIGCKDVVLLTNASTNNPSISQGKSFAATGWRVGWLCGPEHLITPTLAASTRIVFACSSPAQEAVARGIELSLENGFWDTQVAEYEERKKVMMEVLDAIGLPYSVPDGAYFVLVNTASLEMPEDFEVLELIKDRPRDWKMSWFIVKT